MSTLEEQIAQAKTLNDLEDILDTVDFITPDITVEREEKLREMVRVKMDTLFRGTSQPNIVHEDADSRRVGTNPGQEETSVRLDGPEPLEPRWM